MCIVRPRILPIPDVLLYILCYTARKYGHGGEHVTTAYHREYIFFGDILIILCEHTPNANIDFIHLDPFSIQTTINTQL
jgi:hypothetical protein